MEMYEQGFTVTIRHGNREHIPAGQVFLAVQDAVSPAGRLGDWDIDYVDAVEIAGTPAELTGNEQDEREQCDECAAKYPGDARTIEGPWHSEACSAYMASA